MQPKIRPRIVTVPNVGTDDEPLCYVIDRLLPVLGGEWVRSDDQPQPNQPQRNNGKTGPIIRDLIRICCGGKENSAARLITVLNPSHAGYSIVSDAVNGWKLPSI
jgi:hypothetical protein